MLPAFVIGLREGLETVVIIGAIAVFLRAQGRGDLLRRVWRACAFAAAICIVVGLVIRFIEVNLPWRQQEQLETVVGLAAVCMVTYMIVWMRRFPKDLQGDSSAAAALALSKDSGRALVVLAFLAVLREGFEISVFVIATLGLTGSNAWLATGGALLGVVVALIVGVGVVRGSTHLDVTRFFRITALVLVVSTAGIAMATVHTANAAGWITFGQTPQFDLSWIAPAGSVLSSVTTGMFGLQPYPVIIEVIAWFAYFVPMVIVVLWPKRRTALSAARLSDEVPAVLANSRAGTARRRPFWLAVSLVSFCGVIAVGFGLGTLIIAKAPTKPATRRILFATLDGISCPSSTHCVAVGEFLPVDKDSAIGDPDGDGRATHTLAESSTGSGWQLIASPDKGEGGAVLTDVSCPTLQDCVAVGYYKPAKFPLQATVAPSNYPLVESFNGRSWRLVASPTVAPNSILSSVSCPSTSDCVAVGYTTTSASKTSGVESPFAEQFNGRSWNVMSTPLSATTSSGLSSVSCPSISTCVAVGNVAPKSDPTATHPLIEMFVNSHWSSAFLPAIRTKVGILYDVVCPSVGQCVAAGTTEVNSSADSALVLSLSGSMWVTNAAALSQKGSVSLTSVACRSERDCVVTGTSWPSLAAGPKKVFAHLDGDVWQTVGVAAGTANIDGISCPGPSRCLLVGSVPQNDFGNTRALIGVLSGSSWTVEPSPLP